MYRGYSNLDGVSAVLFCFLIELFMDFIYWYRKCNECCGWQNVYTRDKKRKLHGKLLWPGKRHLSFMCALSIYLHAIQNVSIIEKCWCCLWSIVLVVFLSLFRLFDIYTLSSFSFRQCSSIRKTSIFISKIHMMELF